MQLLEQLTNTALSVITLLTENPILLLIAAIAAATVLIRRSQSIVRIAITLICIAVLLIAVTHLAGLNPKELVQSFISRYF